MHGLHCQEQMHVVVDRIRGKNLRRFIPDDPVHVRQQIASHPRIEAVSPSLRAEDGVDQNP